MSVFHSLYNAPVEVYVKDLEDEVMTLRAQLQIMTNDRHVQYTLAQSRLAELAELNKAAGWGLE